MDVTGRKCVKLAVEAEAANQATRIQRPGELTSLVITNVWTAMVPANVVYAAVLVKYKVYL
jgi:hypothetical protein